MLRRLPQITHYDELVGKFFFDLGIIIIKNINSKGNKNNLSINMFS